MIGGQSKEEKYASIVKENDTRDCVGLTLLKEVLNTFFSRPAVTSLVI